MIGRSDKPVVNKELFQTRDLIGQTLASLSQRQFKNKHPNEAYHYRVAQHIPRATIHNILEYLVDWQSNAKSGRKEPIKNIDAYFGGAIRKYAIRHNIQALIPKSAKNNQPEKEPQKVHPNPNSALISWREKRAAVLERQGYTCITCEQEKEDEFLTILAHTRKTLNGSETTEDLIAMCNRCRAIELDITPPDSTTDNQPKPYLPREEHPDTIKRELERRTILAEQIAQLKRST